MSRRSSRLTTLRSALRPHMTYSSLVEGTSDPESSYVPEQSTEVASDAESSDEEYLPELFEPESPAERAQELFLPPEMWLKICDYLPERDVSSMSHTDRFRHSLLRSSYLFRRNVIDSGSSCLPYVAARGDLKLVQAMQTYPGFHADSRDDDGDTALLCAIQLGHDDVAIALIGTNGDHVNMRNGRYGWRPLTLAVRRGRVEVVRKLLLSPIINVNGVKYTDYGRPLLDACRGGDPAILDLLLRFPGLDCLVENSVGRPPLHVAARQDRPIIAKMLLDDGRAVFHALDDLGWDAIDVAMNHGNFDVIAVMYNHGITPSYSQVRFAQRKGAFHSKLIEEDIDRPKYRARGYAMITCAAARGHLGLVSRFLLLASATQRREALLLASSYGRMDVIQLLLKNVSPHFEDERGRTPEWYARQWGHHTIVGLLKDHQLREKRKREINDDRREGGSKRRPIIIDD